MSTMKFSGKVDGNYCGKYYEFIYRIPVANKNISFIPLEEDLSVHERYMNALAGIDMKSVTAFEPETRSVVDYEFVVSHRHQDWLVELFLRPRKYTMAKDSLKIGEWIFAYWYPFEKGNHHKTLDEVFHLNELLRDALRIG